MFAFRNSALKRKQRQIKPLKFFGHKAQHDRSRPLQSMVDYDSIAESSLYTSLSKATFRNLGGQTETKLPSTKQGSKTKYSPSDHNTANDPEHEGSKRTLKTPDTAINSPDSDDDGDSTVSFLDPRFLSTEPPGSPGIDDDYVSFMEYRLLKIKPPTSPDESTFSSTDPRFLNSKQPGSPEDSTFSSLEIQRLDYMQAVTDTVLKDDFGMVNHSRKLLEPKERISPSTAGKREPNNNSYQSSGPVDLDESLLDTASENSSHSWMLAEQSGVILSSFVNETNNAGGTDREDEFSFNVSRSIDIDSPQWEDEEQSQQSESMIGTASNIVEKENEDDHSPHHRTDNKDAERSLKHHRSSGWSQDDEQVLSPPYPQTMKSISSKRKHGSTKWSSAGETVGTVLLTEGELQKHLETVQYVDPLPSSTIQGFDHWRRHKESQQRYFAKRKANGARNTSSKNHNDLEPASPPSFRSRPSADCRHRRPYRNGNMGELRKVDPSYSLQSRSYKGSTRSGMERSMDSSIPTLETQSPGVDRHHLYQHRTGSPSKQRGFNHDIFQRGLSFKDSTRSIMDRSIDSSIPTLDHQTLKYRQRSCRRLRIWNFLFNKSNATSNTPKRKKKSPRKKKAKSVKKTREEVVPLSQFMRISSVESSEVADFSLSPLNQMGRISLCSSIPEGSETVDATYSHCIDSPDVGPKNLALQFLEEERKKQREAQLQKTKNREEDLEKERVERLNHLPLQCQHRSHEKPPRKPKGTLATPTQSPNDNQLKPTKRSASRSTISFTDPSVIIEQSVSTSSKQSAVSSMKSARSTALVAPCIICNVAQRSHIAMPCMHFYFCATCVEALSQSKNPTCPVCRTSNISFSEVFSD